MSRLRVNGDKCLTFHEFSELFNGQYPEKKSKYYYMTINPLCVDGFLEYLVEGDIIDFNCCSYGDFKDNVYCLDGIVAIEFGKTRFSPSIVLKLTKLSKKQIKEFNEWKNKEGKITNWKHEVYLNRGYSDGSSKL